MSELDARRQKLNEMREARMNRQPRESSSGAAAAPSAASPARDASAPLVASTPPASSSVRPSAVPTPEAASHSGSPAAGAQLSKCTALAAVTVIPPRRDIFNRDTMTDQVYISTEAPQLESASTAHNLNALLQEARAQGAAAAKLEADKQVAEAIRHTLFPIKGAVKEEDAELSLASEDIAHFTSRGAFVIQRALCTTLEMSLEGALGVDSNSAAHHQLVTKRKVFFSPDRTPTHVVTAVAFQSKSEFFAVAYANCAEGADGSTSAKGIVLTWSVKQNHPVLEFHSAKDVTALTYSPYHPNILIAGSSAGEVLVWDITKGSKPISRSFPTFESHNKSPIVHVAVVGKQNDSVLVSISQDGRFCMWAVEEVVFPSSTFDATQDKAAVVVATACALPTNHFTKFYLGTADGRVLRGFRPQATTPSTEARALDPTLHQSGVTCLDVHPRLSNVVLSSSVDATCRINYDREMNQTLSSTGSLDSATAGQGSPSDSHTVLNSLSIENFADFVYDAKWSPKHPCVFAAVDGSGTVSFWNVVASLSAPVSTIKLSREATVNSSAPALCRLVWDPEGHQVIVGNSLGENFLVSVGPDLSEATPTDVNHFTDFVAKHFGDALAVETQLSAAQPANASGPSSPNKSDQ